MRYAVVWANRIGMNKLSRNCDRAFRECGEPAFVQAPGDRDLVQGRQSAQRPVWAPQPHSALIVFRGADRGSTPRVPPRRRQCMMVQ